MILLLFYAILGFSFSFPGIALQFYLVERGMEPPQLAALLGAVSIPWIFKPCVGLYSDYYPIMNLHRKPYIILGLLLSGVAYWILPYCDEAIGLVLFLSSLGLCIADVACDSLLVVAARGESKNEKGRIQSYAWALRSLGAMTASILGPFAYENCGPQIVFTITGSIPILFSTLIPLLKEEKAQNAVKNPIKKLFVAFQNKKIYQPALFIILLNITPSYGSCLSFFFETELHFTPYSFSVLSIVSSISAIVGTGVYKTFLTKIPLRKLLFWTLLVAWGLRWWHLVLITRVAPKFDMVFAIAESIALTCVSQLILLPIVVLIAQLTPPGIEGVLYSTFMSLSNLSGVLSTEIGSVMASSFGITRQNFNGLIKLAVLCNIIGIIPIFGIKLVSPDINKDKEEETEYLGSEQTNTRTA